MENDQYTYRYIARFDIETTTPLKVGSGEKNWVSDQLIYRDAFGMPAIRGTSLAGVLRSLCKDICDVDASIFGFEAEKKQDGEGARLSVSAACIIGSNQKCIQTVEEFLGEKEEVKTLFSTRFERDRVRINHRGVADAEGHGKFEDEILPAGAKFRFEIMLKGNEADKENWEKLLQSINSPAFIVGGGTRNGRGQFKVTSCKEAVWDLSDTQGRKNWIDFSMNLNQNAGLQEKELSQAETQQGWKSYKINLTAKDFFLFGAGYGDRREWPNSQEDPLKIDKVYKQEAKFEYVNGTPQLSKKEYLLIPATSIKGALSHRLAYYYNSLKGVYTDKPENLEERMAKVFQEQEAKIEQWQSNQVEAKLREELGIAGLEKKLQELDKLSLEKLEDLEKEILDKTNELSHKKSALAGLLEEQKENFDRAIDKMAEEVYAIPEENKAVQMLFGFAKEEVKEVKESDKEAPKGQRGRVIIKDVFIPLDKVKENLFNHVKIDRFTGGAVDSALFNELTVNLQDEAFDLEILVEYSAFSEADVKEAFENALKDLKTGMLPLGGGTTKGHGVFVEA